MTLQQALANSAAIMSFAEGRRAVCMDTVSLNSVKATLADLEKEIKVGDVIQFGKRKVILVTQEMINCTKE